MYPPTLLLYTLRPRFYVPSYPAHIYPLTPLLRRLPYHPTPTPPILLCRVPYPPMPPRVSHAVRGAQG
eukprot:146047-Rhodomonas_salina.1